MSYAHMENTLFKWASGMHLTECFPDELVEGNEEDQVQWCEDHCLELNEYRHPANVLSDINETTRDVGLLIEQLVKEGEMKYVSQI